MRLTRGTLNRRSESSKVSKELLNNSGVIFQQTESAVAGIAEQSASLSGRMIMIDRELHQGSFSYGSLGLFADGTDTILNRQHLSILALFQTVATLMIGVAVIGATFHLQIRGFCNLMLAVCVSFSVSLSTTFRAMPIGIASGDGIRVTLVALNALRLRSGDVGRFILFAPSRVYALAVLFVAGVAPLLETALAVTVCHLANISNKVFTAPTVRRVGAIPSTFRCSHRGESIMLNSVTQGVG